MDKEIAPFCHEWDETKSIPPTLYKRFGELGLIANSVGSPWPKKYAPYPPPAGISADEWDPLHELVANDEISRCGSVGVLWGVLSGVNIGLPPLLHFGSEELKQRLVPPILGGDKRICLAITEPYAGSDVANLKTEARLSEDGKYFIVNGEKKWITNGVFSDYFVVACRTGGTGMGGISLLVIERGPGVTTRWMNCTGAWGSGTVMLTLCSFADLYHV